MEELVEQMREANRVVLAWGDRAPRGGGREPGCCRHPRVDGGQCRASPVPEAETCAKHAVDVNVDGSAAARWALDVLRSSGRMHVYFLLGGETGLVKIGKTTRSVEERVRALQCGSPVDLVLHRAVPTNFPKDLEPALHRYFSSARISARSEWFSAADVLPVVDQMTDEELRGLAHPEPPRVRGSDASDLAKWFGTAGGRRVIAASRISSVGVLVAA